jgi:ferredoxin/flavodoxin---NADP+ reductase
MLIETEQKFGIDDLVMADNVKHYHKILDVRYITDDTFVLRLERKNMNFVPGQHVQVQIPGKPKHREYSVYSGLGENYLEFLVKEIKEGFLTPLLKRRKQGDFLELHGPKGYYQLKADDIKSKKFLFIGSGTGISPFHSFVKSYAGLDYTVLHGVRYGAEAYDKSDYDPERIIICTSGDEEGDFHGRVTDYLKNHELDTSQLVYLCGNYNMIVDSMDILKSKGFSREQIFVESYF